MVSGFNSYFVGNGSALRAVPMVSIRSSRIRTLWVSPTSMLTNYSYSGNAFGMLYYG